MSDQGDAGGFQEEQNPPLPFIYIGGTAVEVVSSYRYLGVYLTMGLTWSVNTSSVVRKAHPRLYILRKLQRTGLGNS